MEDGESLRLFYALWPDDATRAALRALQARIEGRKVSQANLHITLAFLGQQPAALLPVLKQILAELPKAGMTLVFDKLDYFRKNRIAWAGMQQVPEPLQAVRQALLQALAAHQIDFDRRPSFTPHVTLAREAQQPPDMPFEPIVWQADHIALVQSVTGNSGSSYRLLASR